MGGGESKNIRDALAVPAEKVLAQSRPAAGDQGFCGTCKATVGPALQMGTRFMSTIPGQAIGGSAKECNMDDHIVKEALIPLEGDLMKKSSIPMLGWQRRHVILDGGYLNYYKTEEQARKAPHVKSGCVCLRTCIVTLMAPKRPYFSLVAIYEGKFRIFQFRCEPKLWDHWVRSLHAHIVYFSPIRDGRTLEVRKKLALIHEDVLRPEDEFDVNEFSPRSDSDADEENVNNSRRKRLTKSEIPPPASGKQSILQRIRGKPGTPATEARTGRQTSNLLHRHPGSKMPESRGAGFVTTRSSSHHIFEPPPKEKDPHKLSLFARLFRSRQKQAEKKASISTPVKFGVVGRMLGPTAQSPSAPALNERHNQNGVFELPSAGKTLFSDKVLKEKEKEQIKRNTPVGVRDVQSSSPRSRRESNNSRFSEEKRLAEQRLAAFEESRKRDSQIGGDNPGGATAV